MSSRSPHDSQIVFYLDRNLGKKIVSSILLSTNILCEIHDAHLSADAPDEEWIELSATNDWVALTRDCKLAYNLPAKAAMRSFKSRIIMLTGHRLTGEQIADLIVKSKNKILRYIKRTPAPFLAKLTAGGNILTVKLNTK